MRRRNFSTGKSTAWFSQGLSWRTFPTLLINPASQCLANQRTQALCVLHRSTISSPEGRYTVMRPLQALQLRPLLPLKWPADKIPLLSHKRCIKHQAFDAAFDQDELAEARKWRQSFEIDSLPDGSTSYSRSSGPGGQHVNKFVLMYFFKTFFGWRGGGPGAAAVYRDATAIDSGMLLRTESKATTVWPVSQLLPQLPRLLHAGIRESKYYSKRNDHITIQAQTQRSRTANTDENRQKLFEEIQDLYQRTVPNETSEDKKRKHEAM